MYAIVEVGAKQFIVKKGDIIEVERQAVPVGKEVTLEKVLMVSQDKKGQVGQPYLKDVRVKAQVLTHGKGPKVVSFKYRRRKSSHWEKGHRQQLSRVQIKEITLA